MKMAKVFVKEKAQRESTWATTPFKVNMSAKIVIKKERYFYFRVGVQIKVICRT